MVVFIISAAASGIVNPTDDNEFSENKVEEKNQKTKY